MRTLPLVIAVTLTGCATLVPLQTASTVPPHSYRVGAQATVAAYCTLSLVPSRCSEPPPAVLPVPDLRLSARTGLTAWADAGASVHAFVRGSTGPVIGGQLDAKARFVKAPMGAGELLGSAGLGVGMSAGMPQAGRPGLTQLELAVPLFAGYRRGDFEWIASPRFVERVQFVDINGDGRREALGIVEPGLALGVVAGGAWKWSVQLEYHAPIDFLRDGPITLSVGLLFDFGAAPPEADAPEADTLSGGGAP